MSAARSRAATGPIPPSRRTRRCSRSQAGERGAGVTIGLIEPAIHRSVPDLGRARLVARSFGRTPFPAPALREHGTFSATLLVGQGERAVRGLVPGARLALALVAGADGTAAPEAVAAAIDWLLAERVDVIALPMGSRTRDAILADALLRAARRRVPHPPRGATPTLAPRGALVTAEPEGTRRTTMAQITMSEVSEISDAKVHAVAKRVLHEFIIASEKAVASKAEPAAYRLPADAASAERIFLSRFEEFDAARRQSVRTRVMALVKAPRPKRAEYFGDLARIDLKQATRVFDSAKALGSRRN